MAQNANPLTGNTNVTLVELGTGFVAYDHDDGLIFGDRQLAPGLDVDEVFRNATGSARPDGYKEHLDALAEKLSADDANTANTDAVMAKQILDGEATVFVTNTVYPINQQTSGISSEAQQIPGRPVGALHPANINPGSLRSGKAGQGDEPDLNLSSRQGLNTANTNAARGAANSLAGGTGSGEGQQPSGVPASESFETRDSSDSGTNDAKSTSSSVASKTAPVTPVVTTTTVDTSKSVAKTDGDATVVPPVVKPAA